MFVIEHLHHSCMNYLPITELVQKSAKDDQRDFLFYLAVANYRLKVRIMTALFGLPTLLYHAWVCVYNNLE